MHTQTNTKTVALMLGVAIFSRARERSKGFGRHHANSPAINGHALYDPLVVDPWRLTIRRHSQLSTQP